MPDGTLSPSARPPAFSAPAPATEVDLRPLTTSELIDRGFALYRANFAGFLLLALLAQAAPLLSQIIIMAAKLNLSVTEIVEKPGMAFQKLGLILIISLIAMAIVFCFQVIVTFYIADAYLGKIPSVTESMRRFTSCVTASIWTCVLTRMLICLTFLFPGLALGSAYLYALFHFPATFSSLLVFEGTAFLLFILSLAPVLVVFMRLMVTVPALALEGFSGWKAVKRSSELVRYDPGLGILYWGEMRLSFLLLPLFIIELLILSLTSLPVILFQISETLRHGSGGQIVTPPDSTLIISQIMTFLAGSLIWPLYSIATALFYYDVRIRREGFDLEFMARQLGGGK